MESKKIRIAKLALYAILAGQIGYLTACLGIGVALAFCHALGLDTTWASWLQW